MILAKRPNSVHRSIEALPLTRMQRFVMAERLNGKKPRQIASLIGVDVEAIYKRDQRGRKRLSDQQRTRYVECLKRGTGRRVKLQPLSLSFARE